MITLLTGQPGGGKTLFTVSQLLRPLLGTFVEYEDDDGQMVKASRTIFSNIRGLLLEHEFIDYERAADWPNWCKPGDVIVLDECQKLFVRRPNGSKVPAHTHELEEHRGKYSVDFIVITQHPMLVDGHVQNLVGRHLHMRRVANLALNVIYEWDHCSKSLLFKNSITKKPWRFDKSAYKLYKSARAHTKQPRKVPGLVWFILAGVVGFSYLMPSFFSRLSDRVQDKVATASVVAAKPVPLQSYQVDHVPSLPGQAVASSAAPGATPEKVVLSGCIASPTRCTCFDDKGRKVEQDADVCTGLVDGRPSPVDLIPESPRLAAVVPDDIEARYFLKSQRGHMRAE